MHERRRGRRRSDQIRVGRCRATDDALVPDDLRSVVFLDADCAAPVRCGAVVAILKVLVRGLVMTAFGGRSRCSSP
jgi:hypothetical protein